MENSPGIADQVCSAPATEKKSPSPDDGRLNMLLRVVALGVVLYLFLLSIKLFGITLKNSFDPNLLEEFMKDITFNPIIGLMIGTLVTSIIQSSSATTSIVVSLVAGGIIPIEQAVPIVMGANIGTSVTNTMVSMGHITRREEFRLAFRAAIVHDIFNTLAVLVFLPLEIFTGFLRHLSEIAADLFMGSKGATFESPLDTIFHLDPLAKFIHKLFCQSFGCGAVLGGILVILISIGLLIVSLSTFSKISRKIFMGKLSMLFDRVVFRNPFLAIISGVLMTAIVQSSSITTSLCVPLAAAGILTLGQVFPFTLGANIGTTITAFLAALATNQPAGIIIAFTHFFFNLSGTILFFPIPAIRQIPLRLATLLGNVVYNNRKMSIIYVLGTLFVLPAVTIFVYQLLK